MRDGVMKAAARVIGEGRRVIKGPFPAPIEQESGGHGIFVSRLGLARTDEQAVVVASVRREMGPHVHAAHAEHRGSATAWIPSGARCRLNIGGLDQNHYESTRHKQIAARS